MRFEISSGLNSSYENIESASSFPLRKIFSEEDFIISPISKFTERARSAEERSSMSSRSSS